MLVQDYGSMTEAEAAHAAHDVLHVLAECHRQGICYADVKPANFLLKRPYSRHGNCDSDGQSSRLLELRVVDFGCSQHLQKVCLVLLQAYGPNIEHLCRISQCSFSKSVGIISMMCCVHAE